MLGAPPRISSRRSFLAISEGCSVGVLLVAGEQAPEQDGELVRDGDDGDLVAAGAQALVVGTHTSGLADHAGGRLDQRPAHRPGPALSAHKTGALGGCVQLRPRGTRKVLTALDLRGNQWLHR
jgi:hypothetical protein